ncbi:hypothetical protein ACFFNY_33145 [Paenibacillus hodogayensis]|uniref:Uncharacterized protein n=1 Tax=Paenibacillus hodogayensis TaxID=279208 RepID=A0ABV5W7I1_9BACL
MSISHSFQKLILDQTIMHGQLLADRLSEYDETKTEIISLFKMLQDRLPEEQVAVLFAYEEKINHLHSLAEVICINEV